MFFQHLTTVTTLGYLILGRSLEADVSFVFAGDGGWLIVADVAGKSFVFRVVAIYAPITQRRDVPSFGVWSGEDSG